MHRAHKQRKRIKENQNKRNELDSWNETFLREREKNHKIYVLRNKNQKEQQQINKWYAILL